MPILIMARYTRELIRANPDKFFVFGDNEDRKGLGGQAAEARGEPNAIGIVTKQSPSNTDDSFYTDKEYSTNIDVILQDFLDVFYHLEQKETVVWPKDGIGTGLAQLDVKAPRTLAFIEHLIESAKLLYGEETT